MIAYLKGLLLESSLNSCVIDVHGVGYEVNIPASTADGLPLAGQELALYICTQVREDAITLYGFATKDEKELFVILLQCANGIGGKLALNILSAMPVSSFCSAVLSGDVKALSCINGVGKRTAERLIVDLKVKLAEFRPEYTAQALVDKDVEHAFNDALAALVQLGFKRENASGCLHELIQQNSGKTLNSEDLLRQSLLRLSR